MYSHVACDVMKEQTLYLLKSSSLIWHLMSYLFLFINGIMMNSGASDDLNDSTIFLIVHIYPFHSDGFSHTY